MTGVRIIRWASAMVGLLGLYVAATGFTEPTAIRTAQSLVEGGAVALVGFAAWAVLTLLMRRPVA